MAIAIKTIITDKTRFPDDAKFTLAGEEISFGELRRQNAESQGELERAIQTRSAELDSKQQMQERATTTLANVLENVANATGLTYEQLVAGQVPQNLRETVRSVTRNTTTDNGLALKDDPLYKPLLDGFIAPLQHDMGTVKQVLQVSIDAFKNVAVKTAYLDFMSSDEKPEGFKAKYSDVLQLATNKGYKDENGFPDVTKALREMAGPVVTKTDHERIRKEGYEAGQKDAQTALLAQLGTPTPGTGGISFESSPDNTGGAAAKPKSIREKLDEAFRDPSIAAGMFGGATIQ